jgi:phosphoribosylformylglycinamidine (FGAM) synthase-like amidotransferase family enzyme
MVTIAIQQIQMDQISPAMLCDTTGRHLVMMPHIERSTFQWNWQLSKIETMKFRLA